MDVRVVKELEGTYYRETPDWVQQIIDEADELMLPDDLQVTIWQCISPYEAVEVINLPGRVTDRLVKGSGIGGLAIRDAQVHIFVKDFHSYGLRQWTLAHELGHVDHNVRFGSHCWAWTEKSREAYADEVAGHLTGKAGSTRRKRLIARRYAEAQGGLDG